MLLGANNIYVTRSVEWNIFSEKIPKGQKVMIKWKCDFDFSDFFSALKAAGYQGRVSCECGFDDFDRDVETALHTMKSYLE